jgi:hypothetical protein
VTSERAAARSSAKAERDRAKAAERHTLDDGTDLLAFARRIWALPALRAERPRGRRFPEITWRRGHGRWTSGTCWVEQGRVVVTIGAEQYRAPEVVIHELVHTALPSDTHHSRRFWSVLRAVATEAWPEVAFDWQTAPARGWALDDYIQKRLGPPSARSTINTTHAGAAPDVSTATGDMIQ